MDTCIKVGQKIITVKKHENTRLHDTWFWIYTYIFSFWIDFKEIFKNVLTFLINNVAFKLDFYFLFSKVYNYLCSIKTCIVFEFFAINVLIKRFCPFSFFYYFSFRFVHIIVGVPGLFGKGGPIKRSWTKIIQMAAKTRVDRGYKIFNFMC